MNDRHPSGDSNPADSSQDFSYAPYGAPYDESPYDMYGQQSTQNGYATAYDGSYGDYAGGQGPATDTGAYATYDGYGAYDTYGNYADYGYEQGVQPAAAWTDAGAQELNIPAQQGYESGYGYADAQPTWETGAFDAGSYAGGGYDAAVYATGQFPAGAYDTGAYDTGQYDTGQYDNTAYDTGQFQTGQFDTGQFDTGAFAASGYDTGQYDASQWQTGQEWNTGTWETGQWDAGQWEAGTLPQDTPAPAGSWDTDGYEHSVYESYEPAYAEHPSEEAAFVPFGSEEGMDATAAMPAVDFDGGNFMPPPAPAGGLENEFDALYAAHQDMPDGDLHEAEPPGGEPAAGVPHPRGRRRSPKPKRSALMSVAVPSVAVLGVTGVATASVLSGTESDEGSAQAASSPDAAPVQPSKANQKLDSQLAGLSADADDFADRANRTQERLDLQKRQAEERKRKAAEAARKEALRPKFALPVDQKGLSAQFGSAGVNWFSLHSGIDFPVDEGTPVKAATDGTITTKWDISFGNMAIVTAPDGTETWYCHLSSTKIRSGEVKAGDVFGYSGNSGNSTGPHLHFEVHPGGGDAIDPLPWLRSKGLNPV